MCVCAYVCVCVRVCVCVCVLFSFELLRLHIGLHQLGSNKQHFGNKQPHQQSMESAAVKTDTARYVMNDFHHIYIYASMHNVRMANDRVAWLQC